jgi:flagellar biosynthesis GTPase FlhF
MVKQTNAKARRSPPRTLLSNEWLSFSSCQESDEEIAEEDLEIGEEVEEMDEVDSIDAMDLEEAQVDGRKSRKRGGICVSNVQAFQPIRTHLQIVDIYLVLQRLLLRKLKRFAAEATKRKLNRDRRRSSRFHFATNSPKTPTSDVSTEAKTEIIDKAAFLEVEGLKRTGSAVEILEKMNEIEWWDPTNDSFHVQERFALLDRLDSDLQDRHLRELVVKAFKYTAAEEKQQNMKQVQLSTEKWAKALDALTHESTRTDLSILLRFFFSLSHRTNID